MQFKWAGPNGDPWSTIADWDFYDGTPAGEVPGMDDAVFLVAGYGPLITGDGTANVLTAAGGAHTLTGTITLVPDLFLDPPDLSVGSGATLTIAGTVNDTPTDSEGFVYVNGGQLILFGASADAPALLTSNYGVIGQTNRSSVPSEVDISLGTWNVAEYNTVTDTGDLAVGANGPGTLNIRYFGTVDARTLEVNVGSFVGGNSVLSIGPSGTLAVTGALTIGQASGGVGTATLIDDGALTAGSIVFGANAAGVIKGPLYTGSLTVDAGGLVGGAAYFFGALYLKRSLVVTALVPAGVVTVTSTVPAAPAGEIAVRVVGELTITSMPAAPATIAPGSTVRVFV